MNLFRSEEHVRNWSGFAPEAEEGMLTLAQILEIFSADMFRARGADDYLTHYAELRPTMIRALNEVTSGRAFWQLPK